ncbi:MAG: hypothetical protein IPK60_08725 [Sandaracinaceae bacterium]|nr:hypothetical protein [Sandaracinaceae bacterium]
MRYLALAGAVVSLSACSAGANGGPIAAGDFASALAGAYCEYARSCVSPENDAPLTQRYLAASSSCAEDFLRIAPDVAAPRLRYAIETGTVTYRPDKARECVDSIAATCNVVFDPTLLANGPCAEALVGTIAINGQCHTSAECAGDAYCSFADGLCPGVCVQRLSPGMSCHANAECSPSDAHLGECVTDAVSGERRCAAVGLAADAAEGAPCGDVVAGNALVRTACARGLFCPNGGGTCRRAHAVGDACVVETDYACADGSLCLGRAPDSSCRLATVLNAEGEACDDVSTEHDAYRLCNPLGGLVCTDGTCTRSGSGMAGSRCMSGGILLSCESGLVCDGSRMSCIEPGLVGATCYSNIECESGLCDQAGTGATHQCLATGCGA